MIRLGKQSEIDEYFSSDSVNQSYLKALLAGVEFLKQDEKTLFYEEKGHFIIGSGVDMKLTQEKDAYDKVYHTFKGKKPSDAIMSIVNQVFEMTKFEDSPPDKELVDYPTQILEACDNHAYSSKWGPDARINKIVTEARDYFLELVQASGKQIVSKLEDDLIDNIKMSLTTSKYTNKYFKDSPDIDIFYQVPIYFNYEGVECKALLDMVIINRKKKLVQPIDIKTIGQPIKQFPKAVKQRGYNFQGSFYEHGLNQLVRGFANTPIKEIGTLEGYGVLPFKFLVETTEYKENKMTGEVQYYQGKPLAFVLSERQLLIGMFGLPAILHENAVNDNGSDLHRWQMPRQEEFKGFHQAIELHKWHQEFGYDYDKNIVLTEGNILIQ